ncbi:hypothetical protein FFK22_008845 [Mycobacterium sp. KBS0706]|uniref:phage head-tail joining protein n=1 Tax=Mycobacterium sp. KBS0706 TaxID=2578109 RepID=UPI00110FF4D8|nr:hypothetical protein [Mycobacterium sp. KBS0706]TSD89078.1 hypothetical protein FFK22_008845 [Mycobacterium sp. KBS0706]
MAYTTAERDALQKAIVNGTLRVTHNGRSVEYRSMADLKEALRLVEEALATEAGNPPPRQVLLSSRRGLCR